MNGDSMIKHKMDGQLKSKVASICADRMLSCFCAGYWMTDVGSRGKGTHTQTW